MINRKTLSSAVVAIGLSSTQALSQEVGTSTGLFDLVQCIQQEGSEVTGALKGPYTKLSTPYGDPTNKTSIDGIFYPESQNIVITYGGERDRMSYELAKGEIDTIQMGDGVNKEGPQPTFAEAVDLIVKSGKCAGQGTQ